MIRQQQVIASCVCPGCGGRHVRISFIHTNMYEAACVNGNCHHSRLATPDEVKAAQEEPSVQREKEQSVVKEVVR